MQTPQKIGFVGLGKMGGAIYKGLCHSEGAAFFAVETSQRARVDFERDHREGILKWVDSVPELSELCDCVLVCVKPFQAKEVFEQIRLKPESLLISIVAGVSISQIRVWSGHEFILRAMPNLGALVKESMSVLCGAENLPKIFCDRGQQIFEKVGQVLWLSENQMNLATALSGSGPGFLYAWMNGFYRAALQEGLSAEEAKLLISQTVFGAGLLGRQSTQSFEELQKAVTTPGGTTEAGLEAFIQSGGEQMISRMLQAAQKRAADLA
jgi:pyrroline-5-carboxylate reductase